jgi:hypothetical protein
MTAATDMLAKYLAAEAAILEGKEVAFGDRRLRMEDLDMVIAGRKGWEARVSAETAGSVGRPSVGGVSFMLANFRDGDRS